MRSLSEAGVAKLSGVEKRKGITTKSKVIGSWGAGESLG